MDRCIGKTGTPIHAILDNYATRKRKAVRARPENRPRWTFRFMPTSRSWLKAVEGFSAKLASRRHPPLRLAPGRGRFRIPLTLISRRPGYRIDSIYTCYIICYEIATLSWSFAMERTLLTIAGFAGRAAIVGCLAALVSFSPLSDARAADTGPKASPQSCNSAFSSSPAGVRGGCINPAVNVADGKCRVHAYCRRCDGGLRDTTATVEVSRTGELNNCDGHLTSGSCPFNRACY